MVERIKQGYSNQLTDFGAETLDAEKLAARLVRLHANALVFNVGGIYAWYPTQVPYHTINPLLKNGRDIVKEVVEACRKHSIRFIARYDFSKAVDQTYREHPEWFGAPEGESAANGSG